MLRVWVEFFTIETDGLPDMNDDDNIGRIAFIWDGKIVSGWPCRGEDPDVWTPSEDRFGGPVAGVKKWVRFPAPLWREQ